MFIARACFIAESAIGGIGIKGDPMSEDRLKEIKLAYPAPCGFPAIDWLISEVERLRAAPLRQQADRLMLEVEHLNKDLADINDLYDRTYNVNMELNDTIATLREALEKYGSHILDYSGTKGCRVGITDLEESCRCGFREALATSTY